jgi:hypothetical protein
MGNMVLNVFLSASLNQLWVFMNSLQVIVCLPLLNVRFPQNAELISKVLNTVASFEMIPMENINTSIFSFSNE